MTNTTNITEYLSARTKIKYIFALCSIRERDHILQGLELHVKLVVGFIVATRWIGRSGHARRPLLLAFFGTGSELTAIAAPVHPAFVLTRKPLGQTVHHTQGHGLSLLAPAPRLLLLLLLVSSSRLLLLLASLIL